MDGRIRVPVTRLHHLAEGRFPTGGQSSAVSWVRAPSGEVLLYKRYLPSALFDDSLDRLDRLVAWRHALRPEEQAFLDERVAWVRHIVVHGSRPTGVLVPPAPDPFWRLDKDNKAVPRDMAGLTLLPNGAERRARDFFSIPQTIARLGHLLRTLSFLHGKGVVVGDLRLQNTLVTRLGSAPATYLIDCDAATLHGVPTLRPAEAETMRPDDIDDWPDVLDKRTDCVKFALLAAACIGKNAALMAVTDDVSEHLIAAHSDVLRSFRNGRDLTVSAAQQQTMAETWRRYVSATGSERKRCADRPTFESWTGVTSSSHEIPATSPAHEFPPILRSPRRPGIPARPRAPRTRTPTTRTPVPTQPNHRVIQFVVVPVVVVLIMTLFFIIVGEVR